MSNRGGFAPQVDYDEELMETSTCGDSADQAGVCACAPSAGNDLGPCCRQLGLLDSRRWCAGIVIAVFLTLLGLVIWLAVTRGTATASGTETRVKRHICYPETTDGTVNAAAQTRQVCRDLNESQYDTNGASFPASAYIAVLFLAATTCAAFVASRVQTRLGMTILVDDQCVPMDDADDSDDSDDDDDDYNLEDACAGCDSVTRGDEEDDDEHEEPDTRAKQPPTMIVEYTSPPAVVYSASLLSSISAADAEEQWSCK
jgi:hypothetical protein